MTETPIPPLHRQSRSVSAELAAHFEQLITSGALTAGQRLPSERDLADQMRVSRATIRQAMFELEGKNLVTRRHGSGSVVNDTSADAAELKDGLSGAAVELANATELRDIVEPRIARLAALRATGSNLLQLERVLDRSNPSLEVEESIRLDREFHMLLAHAAQNPLLVTLCEMTGEWTLPMRARSHATHADRQSSIDGHARILRCVEAHDAAGAEAAMEQHLRDVREIIRRGEGA